MTGAPMRRREFITLLSGVAAAWPRGARAQQAVRRIGVLMPYAESDPDAQNRLQPIRTRLRELGWTDGDNVRIDYRWVAAVVDRFRTAAAELVDLKPDVILADSTPSVAALQRETRIIPIVFVGVSDPVAQGFVASLARPGGNITGFTNFEFSLSGKWLGLLKEIAPSLTRVAVVFNPTTAPYADSYLRPLEAAAPLLGVAVNAMPVHDTAEIDRAVGAFAREPNGGLFPLPDIFLSTHRDRILALAGQHRLPMVTFNEVWVRDGGLMSYATKVSDMFQGAASYVDRILRGTKPADLPVQGPTKFVLIINLKTARALGLTVPNALLVSADVVIE